MDADVIEFEEAAHAKACGLTVPDFRRAVIEYGDPGADPTKTIHENWLNAHGSPEASARRLGHRTQGTVNIPH